MTQAPGPLYWLIPVLTLTVGYVAVAMFKYMTARPALRDVPPDQRVEVIDALGRCFERWRR